MMGWISLFTWFLVVASLAVAKERENGILYDHTAMGVRPWSAPQTMRNNDFPNPAPHDLVQTWRFSGMQQPGEYTAIQVKCNKMIIAKMSGTNGCGEYKMSIEDGDKRQELCGDNGRFSLISNSNDITFELHTGPNGGGIVDCSVQAVPVTSDRVVITTTTTTTTKPTRPPYLSLESYEVDSSEHGGEAGPKSTTCPCGWANKATSRIVNGTEAGRNEFPFAAGIAYRGTRSRFCGATIISRYHALTAAHCTDGEKAEQLSLLVGIHNVYKDFDYPAEEIPIERFINHAEFKTGVWINDIALLIMQREIKFSQFVGPACLPPLSPSLNLERQYIKVIGWGAGVYQGAQSAILQKVDVRVVTMKECNYAYKNVKAESPTQICTYATRKASCQGDSGGPVIWVDPETNRYTHVGIVSYGRVCGDESPSVETRVQAYLDWIYHYIRASNKPNSQTCTKIN